MIKTPKRMKDTTNTRVRLVRTPRPPQFST
jgi:hypothetical protein